MKTSLLICASMLAALCLPAQAQQLQVATGQKSGTYSAMLNEAKDICGSTVALVETQSSGSMENMNLLIGNKVNAAMVQADVLAFRAKTEDLGHIKTLVTLHPEEVHVYVKDQSGIKTGGVMGVGGSQVVFQTVKDLANYRVGAVGGTFITAQVIRLQAEIPFSVVEFTKNDDMFAALGKGDIQAAMLVGGAPLGSLEPLKTGRLLSFPDDVVVKLKSIYSPAVLNYANMRQMGVKTVTTEALWVTREYKTAKFTEALGKLRECLYGNLDELKETTGKHPKWQKVDAANKGKWPYYELPTTATAAAPTKAKK